MAFNQRGSGQRALRRDRGDRGGTYGALHATARPDRNHQGPHQLPLVASGGMTLKNSSAGFGITHLSLCPGYSFVIRRSFLYERGCFVKKMLCLLSATVVMVLLFAPVALADHHTAMSTATSTATASPTATATATALPKSGDPSLAGPVTLLASLALMASGVGALALLRRSA